jgi:ubiquinone biosynthesis protein
LLPQLPRLLHQRLTVDPATESVPLLHELLAQQKKRNNWLSVIALLLCTSLVFAVFTYYA